MLDAIAKETLRLHATAPIGSVRQALPRLNPVIRSVVPSFCPYFLCSFTHAFSTHLSLGSGMYSFLRSFRYEVLFLCMMRKQAQLEDLA